MRSKETTHVSKVGNFSSCLQKGLDESKLRHSGFHTRTSPKKFHKERAMKSLLGQIVGLKDDKFEY